MPILHILYGFFATLLLAGCTSLPPPHNAELQREEKSFRPLTVVPPRPEVHVPMGNRAVLEDALKENNARANVMRAQQGMPLALPVEKPSVPMEIPDHE